MIKHPRSVMAIMAGVAVLLAVGCSRTATKEAPFDYPFIRPLHVKRAAGKPYSEYKAFYLLTEDFEPRVESIEDIDGIREVLRLARDLSANYHVPWTHFVDVNGLGTAFISDNTQLKEKCREMIDDLKSLVGSGG